MKKYRQIFICLFALFSIVSELRSQTFIGTWDKRDFTKGEGQSFTETFFTYSFFENKKGVFSISVSHSGFSKSSTHFHFKWRKSGNQVEYYIYKSIEVDKNGKILTENYEIVSYNTKLTLVFEGKNLVISGQGFGDGVYTPR